MCRTALAYSPEKESLTVTVLNPLLFKRLMVTSIILWLFIGVVTYIIQGRFHWLMLASLTPVICSFFFKLKYESDKRMTEVEIKRLIDIIIKRR